MGRKAGFCLFLYASLQVHAAALPLQWDGWDLFFRTLGRSGAVITDHRNADLIIVLGSWPADRQPAFLRAHVANGGALVVASESLSANRVLSLFNMRLSQDIVLVWEKRNCFLGQPDCPVVTDLRRREAPELFSGIKALVTNRARAVSGNGRCAAWFPSPFPLAALFVKLRPFIQVARFGRGIVVAIGDQSLFINLMMPEGDNQKLLGNLFSWTRARKTAVLKDGAPLRPGQAPGMHAPRSLPLPDISPTLSDFNQLIADMQRSLPVRSLEARLLPVFLLLGGLLLVFFVLRELLNTYIPGRIFGGLRSAVPDRRSVALRLCALAPPEARARLAEQALRVRGERRFRKFLDALAAACTFDATENFSEVKRNVVSGSD